MKDFLDKALSAVVIWYNPSEQQAQNIRFYNQYVNRVYVVDNSEGVNQYLLKDIDNVVYLPQYKNIGIAAALNIGCRAAMADGTSWVLTMDQDSKFNQTSFLDFLADAEHLHGVSCTIDEVAIFAPFLDCDGDIKRHHRHCEYEEPQFLMTSGNLLNIEAYQQTGGFREDFFIDWVDDEMCMHLRHLGWHIIRCNNSILTHHLGESITHLLGSRKTYIAHPPFRYFYIGRNAIFMKTLYPELQSLINKRLCKVFKRLLLYDYHFKFYKLSSLLRGIREGYRLQHTILT